MFSIEFACEKNYNYTLIQKENKIKTNNCMIWIQMIK